MERHNPSHRTDGHGNIIYDTKSGGEFVVKNWTTTKKGVINGRIYTPLEQSNEEYETKRQPMVRGLTQRKNPFAMRLWR